MSYGERVIFYQDALMERNKRVDQLKAELTTLQSRLEAVEAERDEALARSRIADKDAEIATDHWYNQFEKQKARVEELQKALKPFARIADIEAHAKPGESVIVNVERCREARAALSPARTEPDLSKGGEE
jgi:predicted RNase H-like nuclease (RuvC/YqgF family)